MSNHDPFSTPETNSSSESSSKLEKALTTPISRRKIISALGLAGLSLMASGKISYAGPATLTTNMKLKKTDPLDAADVNANFDQIDQELGGRAVTPDFYKVGTDPDDTEAVQAAFDSGRTVVFTRNYYVRSVEMKGDTQTINFNGYWLIGISGVMDSVSDKDAILKITGIYLELYDIKINGQFNLNYRAAIHWYSRPGYPQAGFNNVYGIYIRDVLVGIQYGAWLDDPSPHDAPQSENYMYGFRCRSLQNCIISNQPNGFLKISGSTIDCHQREWTFQAGNPFSIPASTLITCKIGQVSVEDSELLKVEYLEGCGLEGRNIVVSNCVIEMPCTWVKAEGDVTIDVVHGGFMGGNSGLPMFQIAPGSEGSLRVQNVRMSRSAGVADYLNNYIMAGLESAPNYSVSIARCDLGEWAPYYIAVSKERSRVFVQDTHFTYTAGSATQRQTIHDKKDYVNLIASVDTTGENMATTANTANKSGWVWTNLYGSGSVYFRKTSSNTPAGYASAIEVVATGESYITSQPFAVTPNVLATFRMKAKRIGGGGHAGVKLLWFKANGTASATVETYLFGTVDIGTGWSDLMVTAAIPSDAAYARIKLTAEVGSLFATGMEFSTVIDNNYHNSFINELNRSLDVAGEGFILKAPNGSRYKVTVDNSGTLTAAPY